MSNQEEFSEENVIRLAKITLLKIQNPHMLNSYRTFLNKNQDDSEADWDAPHHTKVMKLAIQCFEKERNCEPTASDTVIDELAKKVLEKYRE